MYISKKKINYPKRTNRKNVNRKISYRITRKKNILKKMTEKNKKEKKRGNYFIKKGGAEPPKNKLVDDKICINDLGNSITYKYKRLITINSLKTSID